MYASLHHENGEELADKGSNDHSLTRTTVINFILNANKNDLPYSLGSGLCGFPIKQP
jgi:hypothetical protein